MRAKLQSVALRAVLMLMIFSMPLAWAQTAFTFDLPAQSLADSLRAVASATHINIVFDPAVVAGIEAPPLDGPATAREALTKLLAGTGLRYISVGDTTIRIARASPPDPVEAGSAAPPAGDSEQALDSSSASQGAGAQSARAQQTEKPAQAPVQSNAAATAPRAELSEVVVTGTRIAGEVPASPVFTLDRTAIDESGYSSVGQLLLALPENFSGGQNPGVTGAIGPNQGAVTGASTANLYGLGEDSTLTLVNGHRLAYDAYQNGVDLSLIPLAAVERVEVMTDGGSAIYGSDAVAGVVNVILKQHYDGVTADARYGDVTSGQAPQAQYSLLAGHDWGSGTALVAYEYSHDDTLYASERPFSQGAGQPTSLFPVLNRDSIFLSARQGLGDAVSASVDALYTTRSSLTVDTSGGAGEALTYSAEIGVVEYGVSPAITLSLPAQWSVQLDGTLSRDGDNGLTPVYMAGTAAPVETQLSYYQNDLRIGEIQASGPVLQLPSGPAKLAVGAGYRYEGFYTSYTVVPASSNEPPTDASRHVQYAYGELGLPLVAPDTSRTMLESLTLSAAYRYEHYSDFGARPTPKVGIVYVPTKSLRVRATWSKSFRAPELMDVYGPKQIYAYPNDLLGGAAGENTLLAYGANPALGPEIATSKTVAIDITPTVAPGLKITPTYFYIDYSHRIVEPIADVTQSLSNPLYSAFVSQNPTPAQQQALIAQSSFFGNYTGLPYNPSVISDVINDTYQNAMLQRIHGVDLTAQDSWPVLGGDLSATGNATWLTLLQRTIATEPETLLSGTIFYPPSFKARASASWRRSGWDFTAAFNYVSGEWDNSSVPFVRVASWDTVDAQLSYDFDSSSIRVLRGMKISLSVQNLLDRYPPHVSASSTGYPGLGYDSTNASPFGRFISAYLSKSW